MTIPGNFWPAIRATIAAIVLLPLSACATVGPGYGGAPQVAAQSVERGHFLRAPDQAAADTPAAAWWETMGDPVLNNLVEEALKNAPSIDAATARVTQARAGLRSSRTAALPNLGVSASAPYVNLPAELVSAASTQDRFTSDNYSLAFDASWEIDLWGQDRRRVEASAARFEASQAALADAQVSLSAEIARIYIGLRERQAMASTLQEQRKIDHRLIIFARQRHAEGTGTLQSVEQLRAQATQTLADIARNDAEISIRQDQLAVLSGKEPGSIDALLLAEEPIPLPPQQITVGSPANLLRLRPDVRLAERSLAAANADIGVNIADRFPKVSFLGLLGLGGGSIDDTFDPSSLIGLALPRISWSLFNGGRTSARIDASRGAFAEAEAKYRLAALGALGDAESALTRFGAARIAWAQALAADRSAKRGAALQNERADAGTIAQSDALAAQRIALQARLGSTTAQANLAEAFVSVNKALGLGWRRD